jgi:nucleotide-binding universal stress UspA family protein
MNHAGQNTTSTVPKEAVVEHTRPAVVVGVDGSDRNRSAVRWAALEASQAERDLLLVLAVEPEAPIPHFSMYAEGSGSQLVVDQARRHALAARSGIRADTRVISGAAVDVLTEVARDGATLVVGRRGRGGFSRLMVGSVSMAAAGRATGTVVVVPDNWDQLSHDGAPIIVGVDVNSPDRAAIRYGFERAARLGVPLTVVAAWEINAIHTWDPEGIVSRYTQHESDTTAALGAFLYDLRSEFPAVAVRTAVRQGRAAQALLDEATDAQLVVVGARGHSPLGGFPLGSVTRAVLHHAECPIAIVHGGAA